MPTSLDREGILNALHHLGDSACDHLSWLQKSSQQGGSSSDTEAALNEMMAKLLAFIFPRINEADRRNLAPEFSVLFLRELHLPVQNYVRRYFAKSV
jgi:hypothetical protein